MNSTADIQLSQSNSAAKTHGEIAVAEPLKLLTRIGSTTYKVSIRFSDNATETMEQKLLRLIESEVSKGA
jgi:hypothetical protein